MSLVSHTLVFDDAIEGTTSVYTSGDLNETLGTPDRLLIVVFATQVSSASGTPTFTLQIEMSPDEQNWLNVESTPEIDAQNLSTTARTTLAASGSPGLRYVRFRLQLGVATNPKAKIQVWVTGRDNVA